MRRICVKPVLGLFVFPLVMVFLAYLAGTWSFALMDSLGSYDPGLPFDSIRTEADNALDGVKVPQRLTDRVLLIVVDGLGEKAAQQMPFLNELRENGFTARLTVGQPSYSKPGYAAIATGAEQAFSAVVLNDFQGRTPAQTLFELAHSGGLKTAAIADDWWQELSGPIVTYEYYYADADFYLPDIDGKTTRQAAASLGRREADLTLVHYARTDVAGHDHGADSAQYLEAALTIDALIRELAGHLDLSRDTIVVTADHGQLYRNSGSGSGHGGWEKEVVTVPLVAAGAGIRRGEAEWEGAAVDLVPTLSAMLGLPAPAHSHGLLIHSMLDVDPLTRAELSIARAIRLAPLSAAVTRLLGQPGLAEQASEMLETAKAMISSGDYQKGYDYGELAADQLLAAITNARRDAYTRTGISRWPVWVLAVAGVCLMALVYMRFIRRRVTPALLLTGILVYLSAEAIVYFGVYRATYSLSSLGGSDMPTLLRMFGYPAFAGVFAVAVVYTMFTKRDALHPAVAAETAVGTGFLVCFMAAAAGISSVGTSFSGLMLPDFRIAFITLAALIKIALLAAPAVLFPVIATGLHALMGLRGGFCGSVAHRQK